MGRCRAEEPTTDFLPQPQDLISLDTSPAKERLEEGCVHPLEEAMLGCDMDGERPGCWAGGQRGPPLPPTGGQGGSACVSPRCVCLWVLGWASAEGS